MARAFKYGDEDDLERAKFLAQLQPSNNPLTQKAGCETWQCAWSADASYFAWSCGNRLVKLIPWSKRRKSSTHNAYPNEDEEEFNTQPVTIDCGHLVWSVAFGATTHPGKVNSTLISWRMFDFSKNLILATGLNNGNIRIWDVGTSKLLMELVDHRDVIRCLQFAPNQSMQLASASRDGQIKIWDMLDDGNMKKTLTTSSKWLYSCCWSPQADMLAGTGQQKSVVIWDMKTYKVKHTLSGHNHEVVGCEFSPDGALLATSSYDTRLIVWDPHTGEALQEFGHLFPPPSRIYAGGANGSYVRGVTFSRDGLHLASISDDGYLRFWYLFDEDNPIAVGDVQNALCCNHSPCGQVLAAGSRNGCISFYEMPTGIQSLQHISRMAIRHLVPTQDVDQLFLPRRLKEYLKYKLE
ncbi:unnamed protein product [Owenia fusiformis]|uniref:SOCS box domain-containing protein n=1 Tax=Owenia fusiformis TaxID=6347 RepID=A0A8S4Q8W9_OWEFU|nr:unnamed protein product [Owenia fusiformis]